MIIFKTLMGSAALVLVSSVADPTLVNAQASSQALIPIPNPTSFRFQYAAKFLCTSNIPGTSQTTPSVVPGNYATVVYIHNPQNQTVQLRKKIALTLPGTESPGQISGFIPLPLPTDRAIQVDCSDISQNFGISFIHGAEGFLVVESTLSLDVNAVYTAGSIGTGGQVASIAVERVPERTLSVFFGP